MLLNSPAIVIGYLPLQTLITNKSEDGLYYRIRRTVFVQENNESIRRFSFPLSFAFVIPYIFLNTMHQMPTHTARLTQEETKSLTPYNLRNAWPFINATSYTGDKLGGKTNCSNREIHPYSKFLSFERGVKVVGGMRDGSCLQDDELYA